MLGRFIGRRSVGRLGDIGMFHMEGKSQDRMFGMRYEGRSVTLLFC